MSYPTLREAAKLAYANGQSILGWHGVIFKEESGLGVIWWCRRASDVTGPKILDGYGSRDLPGRFRIEMWVKI